MLQHVIALSIAAARVNQADPLLNLETRECKVRAKGPIWISTTVVALISAVLTILDVSGVLRSGKSMRLVVAKIVCT